MADRDLLQRAATCYRRAGRLDDAARCYRGAALHREAAAVWESLGALAEAAVDLARAGRPEQAAWLLVHRLGAPGPARELMESHRPEPESDDGHRRGLLRSLVLARCDVADDTGAASPATLAVLDTMLAELERPVPAALEHDVEEWAVALAETVHRPDLVALLFAAALRGGRHGAAQRWNSWSVRVLGVPLVLPAGSPAGGR
ncbi:hypothetical protein [Actinoplanes derwentensis]|uniref:Tetratricopeptide repeat-containing protein n=1 Tax=Actinoplanes derwentensis TaxID=113562 RepID=A0A1H2AIZ2_9ACTN|nr:hypothetical protein [Actinoplanes derwentensis]GID90297.1 hypothetical protein Ade03nite_92210 [Actinoplanes derwentensis]SDT45844.1 hypothetical protein SAMN04489716_3891 [Actinoplanes derwentensis]